MPSTTHTNHSNAASVIVAPTEPGGRVRAIHLLKGESVHRYPNRLCHVADSTNENRSLNPVFTYDHGNPPNLATTGPDGQITIHPNLPETLDRIWFSKTSVPIDQETIVVCQSKDGIRQSVYCPEGTDDYLCVDSPRLIFKCSNGLNENSLVENSAMIDCKVFDSGGREIDSQELGIGEGFSFDGETLRPDHVPSVGFSALNSRTSV